MKTTQAMCILGGVLLLAVALAYVCAHGLPGDPTLIEQQIDNPLNELPPEPKPAPKNPGWDVFNAWFAVHQKTCPQCSRMKDDPNIGFCVDAFLKLQECLKKPEPPVAPDEPTPVDVPPVAPPAASPSQAAPSNCSGGQCAQPQSYQPRERRRLFRRLFGR